MQLNMLNDLAKAMKALDGEKKVRWLASIDMAGGVVRECRRLSLAEKWCGYFG